MESIPNTTEVLRIPPLVKALCLDVIELIINELGFYDPTTLSACALVSSSLLHMSRKRMYHSVSLDYCESQYGWEQQRLLRRVLAESPHLCHYIRTLRIGLSPDPLLRRTLENLTRVERMHVIGGGNSERTDMIWELEVALSGVFALPTMRDVRLENVHPFSGVYVSSFSHLKHLELYSVEASDESAPDAESRTYHSTSSSRISVPTDVPRRRAVVLESLTLSVDYLAPIADVVYRASMDRGSSSTLDFSRLKQAHIYVWDPAVEDADTAWAILSCASRTLESITLNCFKYIESTLPSWLEFSNLHSIVLGKQALVVSSDPLRDFIRFFEHTSRFPQLTRIKLMFNFWSCEHNKTTHDEICHYRGWGELDQVLAEYTGLTSLVFEVGCSSMYKEEGGTERNLLLRMGREMPRLQRNPVFLII